jgi:hypothetical protein
MDLIEFLVESKDLFTYMMFHIGFSDSNNNDIVFNPKSKKYHVIIHFLTICNPLCKIRKKTNDIDAEKSPS